MISDPSNSILGEPETAFEEDSQEVKELASELVQADDPESHDKLLSVAKGHGIAATVDMTTEEIQDAINDVL